MDATVGLPLHARRKPNRTVSLIKLGKCLSLPHENMQICSMPRLPKTKVSHKQQVMRILCPIITKYLLSFKNDSLSFAATYTPKLWCVCLPACMSGCSSAPHFNNLAKSSDILTSSVCHHRQGLYKLLEEYFIYLSTSYRKKKPFGILEAKDKYITHASTVTLFIHARGLEFCPRKKPGLKTVTNKLNAKNSLPQCGGAI